MRSRALIALSLILAPRVALGAPVEGLDDEEEDALQRDLADQALGPAGGLRTRAETVSIDPRERSLELSGNVRVDAPPFHLRSQRIRLARTSLGVEVDGKGSLAFCPCLGTPLTIDFDRAIVAPPGELFLRHPTLEVYGVPVFYVPWFWLRSTEKVGILPPDLAYRGADGFYLGEGIHVPWRSAAGKNSLDLRGGAYLVDGFVADARLRTPASATTIRFDRLAGADAPALSPSAASSDRQRASSSENGVSLDSRGALAGAAAEDVIAAVAWDADVVRGRRGLAATTDLDAAAKPWDRAAAEGSLRFGPIVAATRLRAISRRGGDFTEVEAFGPTTTLRASGGASFLTWDATVEGGALRTAGPAAANAPDDALSFGRAEGGARAVYDAGPLATSLSVRGAGDLAHDGRRGGEDGAGSARATIGVPLGRAYGEWLHIVDPFVEAAVLHADGDALAGVGTGAFPGRGLAAVSGDALVADGGLKSDVGRWSTREAVEVAVRAGVVDGRRLAPVAKGTLSATTRWFGLSGDAGFVGGGDGIPPAAAVVARARVGRLEGARLLANIAARGAIDPVVARALGDAPLEPAGGWFDRSGTTGGASVVLPWSRVLTTSAGADGDATRGELVGARAGFELHDKCGCLTLRASAAHRLGRAGVDAWVALDFAADR